MNPTNQCTKDNIEEWIKPTLQKENLTNYTITISGNSDKGDGYLGDITFVQVSEGKKIFNFVIKSGKKSKDFRKIMPIRNAFENEIFFYDKILPEFFKFQQEKGVKQLFQNTTKCYDTLIFEDVEVLILEDMKIKGYKLHNRKIPLPRDHIELVMKTYGRLHAISYALRDQKPELFKKLTSNLIDIFRKIGETIKATEDSNPYKHIIKVAEEEKENEIIEKALKLNKLIKTSNDLTDSTDPYAVILHGDCWNNNFLFKYEDEEQTKLSDVCLIDFQLTRLASPAYDLSYFLFTVLGETDVNHFEEFIDLYYSSLCKNLKEMGSDPDKMLPFKQLWKQLEKFSLFGLFMMPSIIQICLSDQDEVPDLVEAAESGTDFKEMFAKSVKNSEAFKNRTLPIMKLAMKKKII